MDRKRGVFYAVGVGPGDPSLMTLQALNILKHCRVIAAPRTKNGEQTALDIAGQNLDLSSKTLLSLPFPMAREGRRETYDQAAALLKEALDGGEDVALVNLGDVSLYATGGYLAQRLAGEGYETRLIPGIPSFCAVAARLNTPLALGETPLHILPGGAGEAGLALPGNKILMKPGKALPALVETLRERGLARHTQLVANCGLPGEVVCRDVTQLPEEIGYFTTILVGENDP